MRNSREILLYENQMREYQNNDNNWILKAKYNMYHLGYLEKMQIDRNMDGVFDEISYFEGPLQRRILRDEDQDGYFELSIENGRKYELDSDADGFVDYTQIADVPIPNTTDAASTPSW